jgi:hypothetical protein
MTDEKYSEKNPYYRLLKDLLLNGKRFGNSILYTPNIVHNLKEDLGESEIVGKKNLESNC